MTALDYVFIASAVFVLIAALAQETVRRPVTLIATALFLVAALVELIVEGLRWQFIGVLAGGVLAVGLAGFRSITGRPRRTLGGVFFGLGLTAALAAVIVGGVAIWGFHPLDLPKPGGTYPVGTTVAYWTDPDRPETATADPNDRRKVTAQIWYPAATAGPRASYLGGEYESKKVAEGLGRSFGVPSFLLGEAVKGHSWATTNAPLPRTNKRYPVVLFSPGLLSVRTQNTAWAEFLAARGYLVVALDHPYDSALTVTQAGEPIRSTVGATGDDTKDDAEADHLTTIRAADLSFALDQFEAMPFFRGRLDRTRIAVAGHSAGGAAALQAAAQDQRFRAAIDIDGQPRNQARPAQPVLALVAGDGSGNPQDDERFRAALAQLPRAERVVVPHTKHLSFTDAPFLLPDLPFLFGTASPHDAYTALTGQTFAFLQKNLGP